MTFGLEVQTRVYDDLDARLSGGDWKFDRADAETYAELAGQGGGAAACAALGLGLASPLCARIGGSIVGWLVGGVWDTFSGLFGGGSDYEARYAEALAAIVAGGGAAQRASLDALAVAVSHLRRLAETAGLSGLDDADLTALLRVEGAALEQCPEGYCPPDAGSPAWIERAPKFITPSTSPADRAAAAPYSPDGSHVDLVAWAVDVQAGFVESLHAAERKAGVAILAAGAAAVAAEAAGVESEGEAGGSGGGVALGVVALLGLGLVLAKRRAA